MTHARCPGCGWTGPTTDTITKAFSDLCPTCSRTLHTWDAVADAVDVDPHVTQANIWTRPGH